MNSEGSCLAVQACRKLRAIAAGLAISAIFTNGGSNNYYSIEAGERLTR